MFAFGQAQVPGAVQPGQIERQFQETPRPHVQREGVVPLPPAQVAPVEAGAVRFVLRKLVVEGSTVYPADVLASMFEKYLGQEVSLAQIYEFASRLTSKYRDDGYILSQVIVPPQTVREGEIRLQAIEGYVEQVELKGNLSKRRQLLQSYAEKIKRSRPLRAEVLERYLLLMNDLNGVFAQAQLTPSPNVPEAFQLIVTVSQDRTSKRIGVHNRNSRSLGPVQGNLDVDVNSLLGNYGTTGLRFVTTGDRELNFLAVIQQQPLGTEGANLQFVLSWVDSEPDTAANLTVSGVKTRSTAGSAMYIYPVRRTRFENLYVRGGLTFHNGELRFLGTRFSEDQLRALRLGLSYDNADRWNGINLIDLELGQGLDAFGARGSGSSSLSQPDGRSDFTKAAVYAARLQELAERWTLLAAMSGQLAFNDLLSPEEFAFGAEPFGRGYDPAELVGDSGAALKLELRYTRFLPDSSLLGYTAYGFYDVGKVWRRHPIAQSAAESAASAGLGVRLSFAKGVTGFVELAQPLTHDVAAEGDRGARFFGGVAKWF